MTTRSAIDRPVRSWTDVGRGALRMAALTAGLSAAVPTTLALSMGPLSPGTGESVPWGVSVDWTNVGGASGSDNNYVESWLAMGEQTHIFKATAFGFSVPAGATITGIMVEVERLAGSGIDPLEDALVRIVKNGSVGGEDRSQGLPWPTSDETAVYGSDGDLWGETWTPADINASGFGFAIAVQNPCSIFCGSAVIPYIDHVGITVLYSLDGGSGTAEGGDGNPAWLRLLRRRAEPATEAARTATLSVVPFLDLDGDGRQKKNQGERSGMRRLPLVLTGVSATGADVHMTERTDARGTAVFRVPPSSASGYLIRLAAGRDGSGAFVVPVLPPAVRLGPATSGTLQLGIRPVWMSGYSPCLSFAAPPLPSATSGTDAVILLERLRTTDGSPVLPEPHSSALVNRREFFGTAVRLLCLAGSGAVQFPPDVSSEDDRRILAPLLVHGLSVSRQTSTGRFADLGSPIRQQEADALVAGIVSPTTATGSSGANASGRKSVSAGYTWNEAALILLRAAYLRGTIPMQATHSGSGSVTGFPSPFVPPDDLPLPIERPCLASDPERATSVYFTDVRPGDDAFSSLRGLVTLGAPNDEGRLLWLMSGTRAVSEFGVMSGTPAFEGSSPAAITETARALLLIACLPPPSASLAREAARRPEGTRDAFAEADRMSGLPRHSGVASRIHYRAQDHLREFDLWLFAFATGVFRGGPRRTAAPLTLREAADLFGSALLFIAVREGGLPREHAEKRSNALGEEILQWLVGGSRATRSPDDPLLRRDLAAFLSAFSPADGQTPDELGLGELWYERLFAP